MVDTSAVLERAISALKRSQRFRAVTDEVRAAEEIDKQRLEKHKFIKSHALRKLTDEEIDRIIDGQRQKPPAGAKGASKPPGRAAKVPAVVKRSQETYPRIKSAKAVETPAEFSHRSGETSVSSPTVTPGPPPAAPDKKKTQAEHDYPEISTMSQISTYKSSQEEPGSSAFEEGSKISSKSKTSAPQAPSPKPRTVHPHDHAVVKLTQRHGGGALRLTLEEVRSTEEMVQSLGEKYRKSQSDAESASNSTKSKNSTTSTATEGEKSSVRTIYDASSSKSAKSGASRYRNSTKSRSESLATYSEAFESPSVISKGTTKSRTSSAAPPAPARAPPPPTKPHKQKLIRISPELGQQLSSIVENLQSMSVTTTEDRTGTPRPRRHPEEEEQPRAPTPDVTYTEDFLSEQEMEEIQQLKGLGGAPTKIEAPVPIFRRKSSGGPRASSKVLVFPPGIEPAAALLQLQAPQLQTASKDEFYSKFLTEVVDSNERMYKATVAAAKNMAKLYRNKEAKKKQGKERGHGHREARKAGGRPKSGPEKRTTK